MKEMVLLMDAREEGREEGKAEGRAEGREEGREEERQNTEAERQRADAAEARIKELEAKLVSRLNHNLNYPRHLAAICPEFFFDQRTARYASLRRTGHLTTIWHV